MESIILVWKKKLFAKKITKNYENFYKKILSSKKTTYKKEHSTRKKKKIRNGRW